MPKINEKKKTVSSTPYLKTLKLKLGCRVMLTVKTLSIGTLMGVVREKGRGEVKILMIKFDSEDSGMETRRCHPVSAKQFPS